jgi:hypothetical protein
MWEYGYDEENQLGTPMALMLLPYWTNDCVDSMEGLLFESASSTPYHFLNQAELSAQPDHAMLNLPYVDGDVKTGISHLQMLGVRYYMAFSPTMQAAAARDPALRLVATSGPWPAPPGSTTVTQPVTWDIYEVSGAGMVAPLRYEPAVVTGPVSKAKAWLDLSVPWYQDPSRWPVPLAASGPASWPRVAVGDRNPPRVPVAQVRPSHVSVTDDRISFDVDRVGSPVVVRTSYFPNWQAAGAEGPWRITPNLMVVVPTSHHVTLHYGWTPVDWLGALATLAGIGGLVALVRFPPAGVPAPADPGDVPAADEVGADAGQADEADEADEAVPGSLEPVP